MKVEIKVPSVGESINEATISAILKDSGSYVNMDDEILEMETDKVNQAVYAPESGVLTLTVKVDDVVKIGQVIGSIDTDAKPPAGVEAPQPEKKEPEKKEEAPVSEPTKIEAPPTTAAPSGGEARKSEDQYLAELQQKKEAPTPSPVEKKPSAPSGDRETRIRMTKLRKLVARRLLEAKNETAMLTTFNEVDMSAIIELRSAEKEKFEKRHGVRLGFMSFFVKACCEALKEFPAINGYIDGEEIVYRNYFDIGVAVGTEKGLMVPVLRDVDQMSFADVEKKIKEYADKARSGKISVDDLQGGGFTISNGGVYGSLLSTPILNPPQSGILGMHAIVKRPIAVNDEVVIRPMMYLALSYDHRIVDGKDSIQFLVHLKNNLEDPRRFLLDLGI